MRQSLGIILLNVLVLIPGGFVKVDESQNSSSFSRREMKYSILEALIHHFKLYFTQGFIIRPGEVYFTSVEAPER